MDLFSTETTPNILPYDGDVRYYGKILGVEQAQHYYEKLFTTIAWKNDEAIVFGKHIITDRKVALYGDEAYNYSYSKINKQALIWTKELLELKKITEEITNVKFNSCLLNLYHNGQEGMAYHSDNEKTLGKNNTIASLSFGAERNFLFKHKTSKQTVSVMLERGSLLVMQGETQTNWLHRLPKTKKVLTPRINLTFRTIIGQ
jgi:alkylated DNA repair dioxygenase AlkB